MSLAHGFHKVGKQVVSVVRARASFGMILHRKNGQLPVANACDGLIIKIEVGDLDLRFVNRAGIESEPMILTGDFDLLGETTGLVEPAMAELELKGLSAQGEPQRSDGPYRCQRWAADFRPMRG